jgi:GNAT superfamily N-acetyltransferase
MDVTDQSHVKAVLGLCERNNKFHYAVYVHLQLAVPPWIQEQFQHSSPGFQQFHLQNVESAKSIRDVYDTRGVLALVGTKVVGFLLYHLQIEDEYPDAHLLYMLVDRDYRRQGHGSKVLQIVIDSHITNIDGLTLQNVQDKEHTAIANKDVVQIKLYRTAKEQRRQSGRELVLWISCGIQRDESCDENLAFYTKNGFHDVAKAVWWEQVGVTSDTENLRVVYHARIRMSVKMAF